MSKWIRDQAIERGCQLGPHRIQLWCPKCGHHYIADREKYDYPEAVMLELECPKCVVSGEFESSTYWDNKGNEVLYDVKLIGTAEHPLAACLQDAQKGG